MGKFTLGLLALIMACASTGSLQEPTLTAGNLKDKERCEKQGPCFVIWATNLEFDRYTIYVNGSRLTDLEGLTTVPTPLYVRQSLLVEGRCATAVVISRLKDVGLQSQRECLDPSGGKYTLQIGPQEHLWWTPWQIWQNP